MLYITQMLRWNSDGSHHYIVGVYSSREGARFAGEVEKSWRGGKYDYRIVPVELDAAVGPDECAYHTSCMPKELK